MTKKKTEKNQPAPEPIYCLFDARPANDYRFAGYFTAAQAMDYAAQAYGRGGKGSDDEAWITQGELYIGPDHWLEIKELDEKRDLCVPVLRKLLLNEPEFDYDSRPAFLGCEIHGILTLCGSIVIKYAAVEPGPDENSVVSARGTMYLPFKNGTLELAYFHDYVRDHPELSKKWVENGPNAIGFDASGKGGATRLARLVEYAKMLRAAQISGLWVEISGSGI